MTGWAVLDYIGTSVVQLVETGFYKVTRDHDRNRAESLEAFSRMVEEIVAEYRQQSPHEIDMVVWEHAQGRNPKYIAQHGELRATLMLAIHRVVEFDAIAVGVWKKQFCGKGNAKKTEVAAAVLARYNLLPHGTLQDVLDAIAIGTAWIELQEV